jgi:hypothetical protein
MAMPTDIDATCSSHPVRARDAALTGSALDLVAAARRIRAAADAPAPAADDARAAIALVGDAMGQLGAAAEQIARRLEGPDPVGGRRASTETSRRMHELVSSLAHARFSAHLASREMPQVEGKQP